MIVGNTKQPRVRGPACISYHLRVAKRPAKSESTSASEPSREITLGPDCRVALFKGPELFLRNGFTEQLQSAIEKTGREVQVIRYDGVTAAPVDVLDECRSMALLAPYKLVIVDDADQFITPKRKVKAEDPAAESPDSEDDDDEPRDNAKRRAMVERYVQSPSEGVTLVLRAERWIKSNLEKYIAAVGIVKDCEPLDVSRACNWTATRARQRYGRAIQVPAVEGLVAALNADLARIDSELAKLASATKEGESISLELVERLVAPVAQERKPWELGDVLLNPNAAPAMNKLHELIERSGIDPVPLRWAAIDTAAKLHVVAQEIARGVPPAAAGKSIKFFFGPRAEASRRVGKTAGPGACADLLHEAIEADWRAKTGQQEATRGLEALVLAFARTSALHAGSPPRR